MGVRGRRDRPGVSPLRAGEGPRGGDDARLPRGGLHLLRGVPPGAVEHHVPRTTRGTRGGGRGGRTRPAPGGGRAAARRPPLLRQGGAREILKRPGDPVAMGARLPAGRPAAGVQPGVQPFAETLPLPRPRRGGGERGRISRGRVLPSRPVGGRAGETRAAPSRGNPRHRRKGNPAGLPAPVGVRHRLRLDPASRAAVSPARRGHSGAGRGAPRRLPGVGPAPPRPHAGGPDLRDRPEADRSNVRGEPGRHLHYNHPGHRKGRTAARGRRLPSGSAALPRTIPGEKGVGGTDPPPRGARCRRPAS